MFWYDCSLLVTYRFEIGAKITISSTLLDKNWENKKK